jgi:acyl-ACP thioesterase
MKNLEKTLEMAKVYEIKSYDVTLKNELKPYALLHYFEDIAYEHAERIGVGYSVVHPQNITWFLLRYNMKFEKLPKAWETLKIVTRPCGIKGVQCFRDFEVWSNDKLIGKTTSSWTLVDLETKRPLNPKKIVTFPVTSGEKFLPTDFGGFCEFEKSDIQKTFEIRFDDIDINQHVNNANYISWALETLPYDFRLKKSFVQIEIAYKQEISFGNKVLSLVRFEENKTLHRLVCAETKETLCDIIIYW